MKRGGKSAAVLLAILLLAENLWGCGEKTALKFYTAQFLSLFDTVTQIQGYAEDEASFKALVQQIKADLEEYHRLYDAYETYEGLVNIKTLNDRTWEDGQPKRFENLDPRLWKLLEFGKELYAATDGQVNIGMGRVLQLWHMYREQGIADPVNAQLPPLEELRKAALHTDLETIVLDEQDRSVTFMDPQLQLDVGAIAKGYALEQVCQKLERQGTAHLLISVGGNIRVLGPRADGSPWQVKIPHPENPEGEALAVVELWEGSLVSSGSYQRYYTVEGRRYHHIINPESLYPENQYLAVTVQTGDSGLADGLSTALFNLSQADGEALLRQMEADACWWVYCDGTLVHFP